MMMILPSRAFKHIGIVKVKDSKWQLKVQKSYVKEIYYI